MTLSCEFGALVSTLALLRVNRGWRGFPWRRGRDVLAAVSYRQSFPALLPCPVPVHITGEAACQPRYGGDLDFVFVVHARNLEDVFRVCPELRGRDERSVIEALRSMPISVSSFIELPFGDRKLRGELVSIPFLATEFRHQLGPINAALREVLAYSKERRAVSVGLGALIPSVSRNGLDLKDVTGDLALTTGHAYNAHVMAEYVRTLELDLPAPSRVGLVGAGGSIGRATLLALQGQHKRRMMTLFDSAARLPGLANLVDECGFLPGDVTVTADLAEMKRCSIVVCATNSPAAILGPTQLSPGTVVIDDTQPPNVSIAAARLSGATVVKCLAKVPGLICPFDFGLFPSCDLQAKQNIIFTCLAETIMLAARGVREPFTFGVPGVEHLRMVGQLSAALGIKPAPFHSFAEIGPVSFPR